MLLPEGTRLVHIGPHKTGTSALQGAFHLARRRAGAQGLHYAGANRQPIHAAQEIAAVTTAAPAASRLRHWRRLRREILAAREPRTLVSSEWFADARPEGIRVLVEDLDPTRVRIAVTLRPLARILPSQWQQSAQAGMLRDYEAWLQAVFREPGGAVGKAFWHRHRHDELVARWAEVVGRDRVTVVVADDRDRTASLRAFERLTGLREGTLVAPDDRQNRSLTAAEVELVRELHAALDRAGVSAAARMNLVLFGAAQRLRLRVASANERRIGTPAWAQDEAAAVQRQVVDNLRSSGVHVIGDLEQLGASEPAAPSSTAGAPTHWPALAASAAMGMIEFGGLARRGVRAAHGVELTAIDALSTQRMIGVLSARISGVLRRRVPVGGRARRAIVVR